MSRVDADDGYNIFIQSIKENDNFKIDFNEIDKDSMDSKDLRKSLTPRGMLLSYQFRLFWFIRSFWRQR